ncbi:class I SAM-dependent methyltransferase [Paenibacillus segetis]|uniref:Methyltransferase n=1 Tax=Paenibacillus segetis TaxID=1325360 RepID=A0ABQ1Y295_9BACL|nr:class I SAM-dependent methyltransferase [Paenibacillus segetis]GGH09395.1 methyltransferase [Paenibacillus segetis]
MNINQLKNFWLSEEKKTFKGWDFSYIAERNSTLQLPWDYRSIVTSYMDHSKTILDMGTGGGELLLSLNPPQGKTFATEAYPPNVELCKNTLPQYGIDVRQIFDDEELPFEDSFFDLIINNHEAFSPQEVFRILKPGGIFVTQQVGGHNNRELSKFLLGHDTPLIHADFNLEKAKADLSSAGLTIFDAMECFQPHHFFDIGALVYYAKIIEWEFPDFSVERCFEQLCLLHEKVEQNGFIETIEHRFLICALK